MTRPQNYYRDNPDEPVTEEAFTHSQTAKLLLLLADLHTVRTPFSQSVSQSVDWWMSLH